MHVYNHAATTVFNGNSLQYSQFKAVAEDRHDHDEKSAPWSKC